MKIITEGKEPKTILCSVEYGDGEAESTLQGRGIDILALLANTVSQLIKSGADVKMIMAAVTAGIVHTEKDGDEE